MNRIIRIIIIIVVMTAYVSCNGDRKELFTSLSHNRTGIKFRNWVKEGENFTILDYAYLFNGAGIAIGDINNDGLQDIYFASNMTDNRLYLNKGNFRFEDITKKSGVAGSDYWNTGTPWLLSMGMVTLIFMYAVPLMPGKIQKEPTVP
jgi:hypothetical protein